MPVNMAFTSHSATEAALMVAHIVSPIIILSYFIVASVVCSFKSVQGAGQGAKRPFQKPFETGLIGFICVLYVGESFIIALHPRREARGQTDLELVFALYSTLAWLVVFLSSIKAEHIAEYNFQGAWFIAFCLEALVFGLNLAAEHRPLMGTFVVQTVFQSLRLTAIMSLISENFWTTKEKASDEETAPLLQAKAIPDQSSADSAVAEEGYGTTQDSNRSEDTIANESENGSSSGGKDNHNIEDGDGDDDDDDEEERDCLAKIRQNWWQYVRTFKIFLPYLWPVNNIRLQANLAGVILCLVTIRVLNVSIPFAFGAIINALSLNGHIPWTQIIAFVTLSLLNTRAGVPLLQSQLWYPIRRNSYFRLKTASFNHLMSLSCDFHSTKKSGVTWQTMSRGTSVLKLYRTIVIDLLPMAADLAIAVSILWWYFDAYMGFVVAVTAVLFWWSTIMSTTKFVELHRVYIKKWEKEWHQMNESSLNWTTVSYFNRHPYETGRYKDNAHGTQAAEYHQWLFGTLVDMIKQVVLKAGLFAASVLVSYQIVTGRRRSVGDFVILISYWGQLSGPLEYFATGFTDMAEHLVDAEKLLALLERQPSIQDRKGAPQFVLKEGVVEFENVSFSYDDKRQVAKQVNVRVEPGETIAFVGETGSGKSTLLKLLFRFYDPKEGRILVDGQDICEVALDSFRKHVGIVPQDPILFNLSVLDNVRYGNLEASDEQIYAACKAVSLHDKIMSFSKGYKEIVGERGVKLSGGELQRVAIARAILLNPRILLLDEATSSVDNKTELQIQKSLAELSACRTTFVIAHRLSTIVNAHKILVIKDGKIVEAGTHAELIKQKGSYNELWAGHRHAFFGTEHGKSNSRSRSPAKGQLTFVNDLIDCGECLALHRQHGTQADTSKKKARPNTTGTTTTHDHAAHQTSHDIDSDRGRSPKRSPAKDIVSVVRRRLSDSQSPKRSPLSISAPPLPLRAGLKPDAPEFIPKSLQSSILSAPVSPNRSTDELIKKASKQLPEVSENSVPQRLFDDVKNEKDVISDGTTLTRSKSVSALEPIAEEKSRHRSPKRKFVGWHDSKFVMIQGDLVPERKEHRTTGEDGGKDQKEKFRLRNVNLIRRKQSASEPIRQSDGHDDDVEYNIDPSQPGKILNSGVAKRTVSVAPRKAFEMAVPAAPRQDTDTTPVYIFGGSQSTPTSAVMTPNKRSARRSASSSLGSDDTEIAHGPDVSAPANTPNSPNSPAAGDEGEKGLFDDVTLVQNGATEDEEHAGNWHAFL